MVFTLRQRIPLSHRRCTAVHLTGPARAFAAARAASSLAADPVSHHPHALASSSPAAPLRPTRVRRRTARQLELQYGPLWYCRSPAAVAAAAVANVADDDHRRALLIARARAVGLIGAAPERTIETVSPSPEEEVPAQDRRVPEGSRDDSGAHVPGATLADSAPTRAAVGGSEQAAAAAAVSADPLLDFLEKNEDDAALLLAMWDSLRRSCLFGSEISESLSLRVRYFFHCLIHRGAVAAALELYHRLTTLGVVLRSSDLVLLFANLPYEHSATPEKRQAEWVEEGLREDRSRARRAARAREVAAAEAATVERHRAVMAAAATAAGGRPSSEARGGAPSPPQAPPPILVTPAREPDRESTPARLPTAAAAGVTTPLMAGQPAWVRRWLLYEASMGHFDLYGDEMEMGKGPSAVAEESEEVETEAMTAGVVSDAERALPMMAMASMLNHLCLLQSTARLRDGWVLQAHHAGAEEGPRPPQVPHRPSRTRLRVRHAHEGYTRHFHRHGPPHHHHHRHRRRRSRYSLRMADEARPAQFWREGVRLLGRCIHGSGTVTAPLSVAVTPLAPPPRALPPSILTAAHRLVRTSDSWRAAYAFGRLLASLPGSGLAGRDAVLFLRLASPHTPWARDTSVEAFVEAHVLPRLPLDTAAAYAGQAVWLAHLCRTRLTRTETFLVLLASAEERWRLEELGDASSAAGLIAIVMSKARLATSHLLVEVTHAGQARRARAALAASVRTGAFAEDRELAQTPAAAAAGIVRLESAGGADVCSSNSQEDDSLLPSELLDAFMLACEAVTEALSLAAVSAVRGGAATAALHDLTEATLYGPFSLWATFSALTEGPPAAAREHVLLVVRMAHTLLRAARVRSEQRDEVGARGQVRLLLELAYAALRLLPEAGGAAGRVAAGAGALPLLDATEVRTLAQSVAAVTRPLLSLLDLHRLDERAVFGHVDEDTIAAMAALGRLMGRVENLGRARGHPGAAAVTVSQGMAAPPLRAPPPLLLPLLSPATRRLLTRVCYSKNTALGRRTRSQLTAHEWASLDRALRTTRRRRGWGATVGPQPRLTPSTTAHRLCVDRDAFPALLHLRSAVYAAVLRGRSESSRPTTGDGGGSGATTAAEDALRGLLAEPARTVCALLLCDVRPARRTVGLAFFADALRAMARDARREQSTPRGPAQTAASPLRSRAERGEGRAAPSTWGAAPLTWEDGVWLFWAAVDHTGPGRCATTAVTVAAHERATMTALLVPLLSFSHAVGSREEGRRWRRGWAARFTSTERQQTAWRQRNIEALAALGDPSALDCAVALYSSAAAPHTTTTTTTRTTGPTTVITNAYLSMGKGEAHTGHRSGVDGLPGEGQPHTLLCAVALRHHHWERALQAVTSVYGAMEAHEAARTSYPVEAAHTLLTILGRCPTNLSNTGLRLYTIQTANDTAASDAATRGECWDTEASVRLLRLLLRARRWRPALQVAEKAMALPTTTALQRLLANPPTPMDDRVQGINGASSHSPEEQAVLAYVELLVLSIQACAIGGEGETATAFYDQLQAVVRYYRGGRSADGAAGEASGESVWPDSMDPLESALAKAHGGAALASRQDGSLGSAGGRRTTTGERVGSESLLQALDSAVSRARPLFFRAVTKKMMATPARGGGSALGLPSGAAPMSETPPAEP